MGYFLKSSGIIEIKGEEKGAFLQGLFSQDTAKNFVVGQILYGIFPDIKGKILSDAFVLYPDPDRFFLIVPAVTLKKLFDHLQKYLILISASIGNLSDEYVELSILNEEPVLQNIPQRFMDLKIVEPNSCLSLGENQWVYCFKSSRYEQWGFVLKKENKDLWIKKLDASGILPYHESEYEAARVELQIPEYGKDMDENTFPQEVRLEKYLNLKKGCFIGAEILQRIHYQGHVNRTLASLQFEDSDPIHPLDRCGVSADPAARSAFPIPLGTPVIQEGSEVGKITSSVFSKKLNQTIALAILKRSALGQEKTFYALEQKCRLLLHPLTKEG